MKMKRILSLLLTLMMLMTSFALTATVASAADTQIKNIIYLIPDGGGMDPFYLADAVKQAGGFNRSVYPYATQQTVNKMYLKDYLVGGDTTHSANYAVTDSAAGGTALATGKKTNNYYIGIDQNRKPIATILEAAQTKNMRTGLVSTYPWAHATPASFSAHALDRYYYRTIAEQQINQGLDVVLPFNATGGYAFDEAAQEIAARGYTQVSTLAAMKSIQPGTKVWGDLGGQMSYAHRDITNPDSYPTLAEMTEAAITALNVNDGRGFFLMVEGSAVDGGGHANNAVDMVSEFIAFDEACKIAIEFAKGRTDTVVVAVPDHDTGGMTVKNQATAVSQVINGTNPSSSVVAWEGGSHTARNGGVFVYTPAGVSGIPGTAPTPGVTSNWSNYVIDNTAIAKWLATLIDVDLDEVTAKLFVDVSRMGKYTPTTDTYYDYDDGVSVTTSDHTGYFKFNDYDLTVVRNQSIATYNGQTIDMNGEVAVHSGGRFYVPQNLLDQLGIEVDNSGEEAIASSLVGEDLANNVIDSAYCTINKDNVTMLQSSYTKSYVTFQIGVPKTAYYDVQMVIDTSNRPNYGNALYGALTGVFDDGQRIQFNGKLASYTEWVDDLSDSVLLTEGNHTITFTTADAANNILLYGLQLVENVSMGTPEPEATPTPTPAPVYDYTNITKENAPYAGVYLVSSDKAVTLTNETGHTVTLAVNSPAYFYMIKGNNNITMSDSSATLTFTALTNNGLDYIAQVEAGTAPLTDTHVKIGWESVGNIADNVSSTYGNVTVNSSSISIPNSSSATISVDIDQAGLYYMGVITTNAATYLRLETDTGHYGQYSATAANSAAWYEDGTSGSDILMVYLRKGTNYITIANNGTSTATVSAVRCSKTNSSSLSVYTDQLNVASCKVVYDAYDPDAPVTTPAPTAEPTATPAPTEAPSLDNVAYTNAPYAGVYEVTSDKAVTLTNETEHTVTLAAGETKYFYLIKGNNNLTVSDTTATLTFTGLADNGMAYISEVDEGSEPHLITDTHYTADIGSGIYLGAGQSSSFTVSGVKAGLYYMSTVTPSSMNNLKVSSDTGFYDVYTATNNGNASYYKTGTDMVLLYLREGANTITYTNEGSVAGTITIVRISKTDDTQTVYADQHYISGLHVTPYSAEEPTPTATPVPTPVPTAVPTPVPTPVPTAAPAADEMIFDAPYAGVYKASSDKAVTLINETGHKVTLSAGGTGYYYMVKGANRMTTSNKDATVTFTALANNGISYLGNVAVDHVPLPENHVYLGYDEAKDGGIWNIVDFVHEAPAGLTYGNRTITIPANSKVVLSTPESTEAGLYYIVGKSDIDVQLRVETSTGYYGVYNTAPANTSSEWRVWSYEGNDSNDWVWVYLSEGVNYITIYNNTNQAMTTNGVRPSRGSSFPGMAMFSACNVIPAENVVIPTPTPTPVPAGMVSYDAVYAGVYAVTSDVDTTVATEIGSTATVAAGETKYIYLVKGANTISLGNSDANITITGLSGNGMDYMSQVTIPTEPIIYGQEDNVVTGLNKTLAPGESYVFTYTAGQAGLVYPYILFGGGEKVRVTTDTGFYTDLGFYGNTGYTWAWEDAAWNNLSVLYVREGVNTITITNNGSINASIANINIHSVGELVNKQWAHQLNVAYLKPVIVEDSYSAISINRATKTATVSYTNMGVDDDGTLTFILASYNGNKLTELDITYIDTEEQAVGTTLEYSVDLPEATGATLKAMLLDANLVPKALAKEISLESLEGLNFSILGDSISTYDGWSNDTSRNSTTGVNAVWYPSQYNNITSVDQTWWKQVADETGMNVLVNNAYSGDRMCYYGPERALQLHNNEGVTPDVIAVFFGTNDLVNGCCTSSEFEADYDAMIASIQEAYPDAEIYLLNLLYSPGDHVANIPVFNSIIEDAAETYGCTYVDLYNETGINASNLYDYMGQGNGLHPDQLGMDLITECVVEAMGVN